VHELLWPQSESWPKSIAASGFTVIHDREVKERSYLEILRAACTSGTTDPYLLFHHGQEAYLNGRLEEAANQLERLLQLGQGYRFHLSEAGMILGHIWARQGDVARALRSYKQASRIGPRAEPFYHAALLAVQRDRPELALRLLKIGRGIPMPTEKQPFGELAPPYVTDWRLYEPQPWLDLEKSIFPDSQSTTCG
jgi:tetratricopeptide (TPR) repeat protein